MSNNLGTTRISAGMDLDAMGAASNDVDGDHDAAMTEGPLDLDFSSAGSPAANTITLTASQFIRNHSFQATSGSPGPSGACTLNVPAVNAQATTLKRGFFLVINDLAFNLTVQKVGGQSETAPVLAASQRSILDFDGSNVRVAVPVGVVGSDGVSAGIKYLFDTSTTTSADPGSGNMRLNNATLASVTEIALSDNSAESGNPSVEPFLATWDDGTSAKKGDLIIKKRSAPQNFDVYEVTGSTNESGWWRFAVTYRIASGSFSAADALDVQFIPKGDQGAGSTVTVEEENVSVLASASILNFAGADFNVTDAGGGQANIALATAASTFSGALVNKAADQTAANYSALTAVAWDAEEYDVGGWHDNVTNNTRLTVPSGVSRVRLVASIITSSDTSTDIILLIYKNGVGTYVGFAGYRLSRVGTGTYIAVSTAAIPVSAGDYFEAMFQTSADTSITVESNSSFGIEKVS